MLSYKVLSPFYKGMQEHPIPSHPGQYGRKVQVKDRHTSHPFPKAFPDL